MCVTLLQWTTWLVQVTRAETAAFVSNTGSVSAKKRILELSANVTIDNLRRLPTHQYNIDSCVKLCVW